MWPFARRPPTDFALLREIYTRHRDDFVVPEPSAESWRATFVSADLPAVAESLGVTVNSIFGRLYYHLDPKYAPRDEDDGAPKKRLFAPVLGDKRNCVNFPLLEAVLADLWQQRRRDLLAVSTAFVSAGIAVASLVVSIAVAL